MRIRISIEATITVDQPDDDLLDDGDDQQDQPPDNGWLKAQDDRRETNGRATSKL